MKENTEKQEQVIQEVKTEETNTPVEQQTPPEEKVSYSQVAEDGTFKVDLSKLKQFQEQEEKQKENEPVQKSETKEVDVQEQTGISKAVGEEIKKQEEETQKEEVVLEEVSQEEVEQQVEQQNLVVDEVSPEQPKQREVVVPENLQDLVKFMEETGGSLEDYTRLNADYSKVDDSTLLKEYYKNTKPHLDLEEIDFLIEDTFYFDEDIDEPRNIKKKKLAFKEEIVKAKKHLTGLKDQYYKEVKLGSKLTSEQKEALDFYNKYNQEQAANSEIQKRQIDHFQKSTNNVFNNNFKGFDFNVGDKTYRYNINNVQDVKTYQSDIVNFVGEFLDENDMMKDAKGYHKALYAGKNIDKIVKHFYEQGKADAIRESAVSAKNIDMSPRTAARTIEAGGVKVRAISGDDMSGLKFKIGNK
tara:strand:- start:830 stop:2071 length:1242 start_codon:yes stop_codon:yes gene_type:complete